mmetsp:Transcript_1380/g.4117  ORF Transcript_1380/g.4117 Transcript_1380/m.4117 type:complete len:210 (-) Transcript_1380:493-1122(-)
MHHLKQSVDLLLKLVALAVCVRKRTVDPGEDRGDELGLHRLYRELHYLWRPLLLLLLVVKLALLSLARSLLRRGAAVPSDSQSFASILPHNFAEEADIDLDEFACELLVAFALEHDLGHEDCPVVDSARGGLFLEDELLDFSGHHRAHVRMRLKQFSKQVDDMRCSLPFRITKLVYKGHEKHLLLLGLVPQEPEGGVDRGTLGELEGVK